MAPDEAPAPGPAAPLCRWKTVKCGVQCLNTFSLSSAEWKIQSCMLHHLLTQSVGLVMPSRTHTYLTHLMAMRLIVKLYHNEREGISAHTGVITLSMYL